MHFAGGLVALTALAWQSPQPMGASIRPARMHQSMQRAPCPILQEDEKASSETDDVSRSDYIRSGGFIDGRPPDDLDKIATFSFADVELTGKIMLGLGGSLLLTLIVYLIVA